MVKVMLAYLWLITICLKYTQGNIPECAVSTFGGEYRGHVSVTTSGRTCQRWDSQFPHKHSYDNSLQFPDRDIGLAGDYCRNPVVIDHGGVWCYTTDPGVRFEYCDVPKCPEFSECKLDEVGEGYRGTLSVTASNVTCLPWDEASESLTYCRRGYCHLGSADAEYTALDSNYCRNPDSKPEGPWCYVENGTSWEYCDVPYCKPSASCTATPSGAEYVGTVSTTRKGAHCQRWDDPVPHQSNYTSPNDFPDETVADAANLCRNPRGNASGVWCYTNDPQVEWDYCDVRQCAACKLTDAGADYAGTVAMTSSGYPCQRWNSQSPHEHNMTDSNRFPDMDLVAAENYCRNPDGRADGPWCFTTDPGMISETCGLPMCTGSDSSQMPKGVRHVLHIGIDGLHPCLVSAPAPNFMNRLTREGSWTLNARSIIETWSAPCWTSVLCSFPQESSGMTYNDWLPPWNGFLQEITPATGNDVPFPCVFDVLKDQDKNIRTASFHQWDWLQYVMSTGLAGRMDTEIYCNFKIPLAIDCDNYTMGNLSDYLTDAFTSSERSYTFAYMMSVDEAGHYHEWCSETYYEQVRFVDWHVGQAMDLIESLGMTDEVMLVVTSDHGGKGTGHGEFRDDDIIVPMFIKGPGIKVNYEMKYEVRNIDVIPTILKAMGYKRSPWWKGIPLDQIFV